MNKRRAGGSLRANFGAIKWTLKKFFGFYPVLAPLSIFCILFSAVVSAIPSLFVQNVLAIVEQWYFILQDSSFTYTADKGPVAMEPYDITYTDRGVPHGSKAEADENINYFWVELATDGYPEVDVAPLTEEDRAKMVHKK